MNEEFFGKEPEAKPKEEESKYPDPFTPEPEIIYGLEMIGGVAQDGSRYKQPRILHKDKVSKKGVPYTSYWVTVKATPIIINDDGNPETPYERKEYTWFVPSQCIEKVQEYFDAKMYQLCFQKLARLNPETGERHNDYLVGKQVKDFVIFPDTNKRIHTIFGSKDAIKEKPEAQPEQKLSSKLEQMNEMEKLDVNKPPFDSDTTADPIAFKKDITPDYKPEVKVKVTTTPPIPKEVNVNGEYALEILKGIELALGEMLNIVSSILMEMRKKGE